MRRFPRLDINQGQIAGVLRKHGCSVQSLASIGNGCPDLLVGLRASCPLCMEPRNLLFEVKNPDVPPSQRKLTVLEDLWHARWRGQIAIVKSIEEALEVIRDEKAHQKGITAL